MLIFAFLEQSRSPIQLHNLSNRKMQTKIGVTSLDNKMVKSHHSSSDSTSTTSTSLSNSQKKSVTICRENDLKNNMASISQKLLKVHSSSVLGTAVRALDDLMKKKKKLENFKKYNELKEKNTSIMSLIQKCLQKKPIKAINKSQNKEALQNNNRVSSDIQSKITQERCFQFDIYGQKETFMVIKFINEGISGKVYLVRHSKTGFIFSLKVIPRNKINPENTHQLIRQLKIQSYLNHPNIIKLYHFHIDQENVHLLLEPCLGSDLFKEIKNHPNGLPEKQVKNIIRQVSSAVQYMHKNDIIHRDLKLQNILLCDGVVKICDFGWAVYSPLLRSTKCGTPLYVSPQMLKSELYDSKIDIWNIGILTYELIYGHFPFEIRQQSDFLKIIEQDVFFSSSIIASQSLQKLLLDAQQKILLSVSVLGEQLSINFQLMLKRCVGQQFDKFFIFLFIINTLIQRLFSLKNYLFPVVNQGEI